MNNLKTIRQSASMTQEEVGIILGVDHSYLARIESGRIGLTEKWVKRFCEVYRVTPNDLFPEFSGAKMLPMLGEIPAGQPLVIPEPEAMLELTADNENIEFPNARPGWFAMKVRGQSMNMIASEGQHIVVNPHIPPIDELHGRLVVANIGGDCTFKRLKINPLRLEPRSFDDSYETIFPDPRELIIVGVIEWIIAKP